MSGQHIENTPDSNTKNDTNICINLKQAKIHYAHLNLKSKAHLPSTEEEVQYSALDFHSADLPEEIQYAALSFHSGNSSQLENIWPKTAEIILDPTKTLNNTNGGSGKNITTETMCVNNHNTQIQRKKIRTWLISLAVVCVCVMACLAILVLWPTMIITSQGNNKKNNIYHTRNPKTKDEQQDDVTITSEAYLPSVMYSTEKVPTCEPNNTLTTTGTCYALASTTEKLSWYNGRSTCGSPWKMAQMETVEVRNLLVNASIFDGVDPNSEYWIQGSSLPPLWYWHLPITALITGWTNWAPSQPDSTLIECMFGNATGVEHFWYDGNCLSTYLTLCQRGVCEVNPCVHGSCSVVNNANAYTCTCVNGYTGTNCETSLCVYGPCDNGGTCSLNSGGVVCSCVSGYNQPYCQTSICSVQTPCENNGTCAVVDGTYSCNCTAGYSGRDCQSSLCDIFTPCENSGTCTMVDGTSHCTCVAGYSDTNCSTSVCEILTPCDNGGSCTVVNGTYNCDCVPGYYSENCTSSVCDSDPCENGGDCSVVNSAFYCNCSTGYSGHNCSINIDDCFDSACGNGGTCVDGVNSYTCSCVEGYLGSNCYVGYQGNFSLVTGSHSFQQAYDICWDACTECSLADVIDADELRTLREVFYVSDAPEAVWIDLEREEAFNVTLDQWVWSNWYWKSFGYDVDSSFVIESGSNACAKMLSNSDSVLAIDAGCEEMHGYICEGDFANPCEPNPCHTDSLCSTIDYRPQCLCHNESLACEDVDPCNNATSCLYGGSCYWTGYDSYFCVCTEFFSGYNCQINEICNMTSPCENNGTCLPVDGWFYCDCVQGYSGELCQYVDCSDNLTLNNGIVLYPNGLSYNSSSSFACFPEFALLTSYYVICNENGSWVGEIPRCVCIDLCDEETDLAFGRLTGGSSRNYLNDNVVDGNETSCYDAVDQPLQFISVGLSGNQSICGVRILTHNEFPEGLQDTIIGVMDTIPRYRDLITESNFTHICTTTPSVLTVPSQWIHLKCESCGVYGSALVLLGPPGLSLCELQVYTKAYPTTTDEPTTTATQTTTEITTTQVLTTIQDTITTQDLTTKQETTTIQDTTTTQDLTTTQDTTTKQHTTTVTTDVSTELATNTTVDTTTLSATRESSTEAAVQANITDATHGPTISTLRCSEPVQFDNSDIVESYPILEGYVTYECKVGYEYMDSVRLRTFVCGVDTDNIPSWHIDIKDCQRKHCPALYPPLENAICSVNGLLMTCECLEGMLFTNGQNVSVLECEERKVWSRHPGDCLARCKELSLIRNAQIVNPVNHSNVVGASVEVMCLVGHRFPHGESSKHMTCLSNGEWMDIDHCYVDTCQSLTHLQNVTVNTTVTIYNTYVQIMCEEGHTFTPGHWVKVVTCMALGIWNDSAIEDCVEIDCPPIPLVENANITGSGTGYDSTVHYSCHSGFGLSIDDNILRLENGQVSISISCQQNSNWTLSSLSCQFGRCAPVPVITHTESDSDQALPGSVVTYTCHTGHIFPNDEKTHTIQCADTQWNVTYNQCQVMHCPPVGIIRNATVPEMNDTSYLSTTDIVCDVGFTIAADSDHNVMVAQCTDTQQWSVVQVGNLTGTVELEQEMDLPSQCIVILCGKLPPVVNSIAPVSYIDEYQTAVKIPCKPGFWFSRGVYNHKVICSETGKWEPEIDHCISIQCLNLPTWQGAVINDISTDIGTTVNVSCFLETETKHLIFEDSTQWQETVCSPDGEWEPAVPNCIDISNYSQIKSAPVEAKRSKEIGSITLIVFMVPLAAIVIIDIITRWSLTIVFSRNLHDGWLNVKDLYYRKAENKVEPLEPVSMNMPPHDTATVENHTEDIDMGTGDMGEDVFQEVTFNSQKPALERVTLDSITGEVQQSPVENPHIAAEIYQAMKETEVSNSETLSCKAYDRMESAMLGLEVTQDRLELENSLIEEPQNHEFQTYAIGSAGIQNANPEMNYLNKNKMKKGTVSTKKTSKAAAKKKATNKPNGGKYGPKNTVHPKK